MWVARPVGTTKTQEAKAANEAKVDVELEDLVKEQTNETALRAKIWETRRPKETSRAQTFTFSLRKKNFLGKQT